MITSAGIVSTFAGVPPGQGNNSGQPGLVNGPAATARFDAPNAVAVDDSTLPTAGTVYVADTGNNLVRSISGGTVSTVDTTAVIPLNTPLGVAVDDSTGNVYVADTFNNRIVEIKNGGPVSVLAGGTYGNLDGSGAGAKFALPFGIAVDNSSLASAGTLYVADTYNNTIRKVTPGGAVTTLAGSGTPGFADGTGTAAMFNRPGSIAVDPGTGNVYVADTYNQVVRMIVPATGAVITLAGTGMTVANTGTGFEAPGGLPGNLAFPFGIAVAPGLTSITDVNSVTYSNPGGSLLISVGDAILATPF
jgi:DNA-binding beta-propeller fold protein YncE